MILLGGAMGLRKERVRGGGGCLVSTAAAGAVLDTVMLYWPDSWQEVRYTRVRGSRARGGGVY